MSFALYMETINKGVFMKFSEIPYVRPDFDYLEKEMTQVLDSLETAPTKEQYFHDMKKFYDLSEELQQMMTLSYIRYTINTKDAFYEKENEVYDEIMPKFQAFGHRLGNIRLTSPHREAFEEAYGKTITMQDEMRKDIFDLSIIEDRVKEAKLATEYQKLTAAAQVEFDGKKRNISQMTYYFESQDRMVRKEANEVVQAWYHEHQNTLDKIYDDLVQLRTSIAQKLGFKSYDEVAYREMGRLDWTKADAKKYRQQIIDHIVPLASKLYKEQAQRIGVDEFKYYDIPFMFKSGNPMPVGDEPVLVEAAQKMYRELSEETAEFFDTMVENQLMDLTTKDGKAPGGYMTFLAKTKLPFIFSNFNGTSGDVDVLTHEAGHAFQGYVTRDVYPRDNAGAAMEIMETHSMAMEYFTHPWMENFFGEDTEKYYYSHVVSSLLFLPYGASIDAFQEWVYENPQATAEERRAKYREIEGIFLPHLDYDGNEYLENGGRWQRQLHVYMYPMYYLDYTIAQVNAFQYFAWDLEDHEAAWESYLKLCELGGRYPSIESMKKVGLKSPFEDGTMLAIVEKLEAYLDGLDKSKIV